MTPFFSIIIPVYNVAPYLRECLDSVLAQTFTDWEAICVDDGSTDGSSLILDEYAKITKKFRVIKEDHKGVSYARNKGLELAMGLWVGFVDGDDFVAEDWLSGTQSCIKRFHPDVVRCSFAFVWPSGECQSYDCAKFDDINGERSIFKWCWTTYPNGGWVWLNFFRHELLRTTKTLFIEGMSVKEDVFFCVEAGCAAKRIVQEGAVRYYYRMRKDSSWHRKRRAEDIVSFFKVMLKHWNGVKSCLPEREDLLVVKNEIRTSLNSDIKEFLEFGDHSHNDDYMQIADLLHSCIREDIFTPENLPIVYRLAISDYMRNGSGLSFRAVCWIIAAFKYIVANLHSRFR